MDKYFQQQVREPDVHFIANELFEHELCVEKRSIISGALGLWGGRKLDLERSPDSYVYFRNMILEWIGSKKGGATTSELDRVLRQNSCTSAAESIQNGWFTEKRTTAVESNVGNTSKPLWFNMTSPISLFTGREDEFKTFHDYYFPVDESHQKFNTVAIYGLGGIGKSEFARKIGKEYYIKYDTNVAWINAINSQQMQKSFKDLAAEIEVGAKSTENQDIMELVHQVYEHFSNSKSLFIFDNVETWFAGEYAIYNYLPKKLKPDSVTPLVLMTSDFRPGESESVAFLELKDLTDQEAVELIQSRLETQK